MNLEVCQEVFEKRRNILGDDDPATLRILSNIASIYMQTGEYYEACLIYKRISEKQEELLKNETANHSQEKQVQLYNENIPDEQRASEFENHNEPLLLPIPTPPPLVPPPPPPPG